MTRCMQPKLFMEDQMVFCDPRSPCDELTVLIQGAMDVIVKHKQDDPKSQDNEIVSTVAITAGQIFECTRCARHLKIPRWRWLSCGPHALRAKSKTFTLGLQLEQADVTRVFEKHEALAKSYTETIKLLAHFMNPDTLRKDWLFCGANRAFLTELAPHWVISAEGEGRTLLDENRRDTCIVVVRGVVEVRVLKEGATKNTPPLIRRITAGNMINVAGLIGGNFGEQILSAEVVQPSADDVAESDSTDAEESLLKISAPDSDDAPPPALIIKLSQAVFKRIAQKPEYATVEPLMRRIAMSLSPLLTLEGLMDPKGSDSYGNGPARLVNRSIVPGSPGSATRASPSLEDEHERSQKALLAQPSRLPDLLMKMQLEVISRRQEVKVMHKTNEVLFETSEFHADTDGLRKAATLMDVNGLEKALAQLKDTTNPDDLGHWGLDGKMYFVVEGELEAICISDMTSKRKYDKVKLVSKIEYESKDESARSSSKCCTSFITPYDQDLLGRTSMPMAVRVVVRRTPVILVSVDLNCASSEALEKYAQDQKELLKELEERERVLQELKALEKQAYIIQERLGLREPRKPPNGVSFRVSACGKSLWWWARKQYRVMKALNLDMSVDSGAGSVNSRSSMEDSIFKAKKVLEELKGAQIQRINLFQEIVDCMYDLEPALDADDRQTIPGNLQR